METVDLSQAVWRKSSYSSGNGQCVEVASASGVVGVRDSKHPDQAPLTFSPAEWRAFVALVVEEP
ncbi:DUF397 domain-containing protein [Streptomyces europaeiscabiei]|uniref:DUF397 domain-containing protein n=1 Tax=Streptomyces europaeiscabiei TaxID=146819 RepID=UPI00099B3CC0|nr:DUF397 domain-containing protein [Streptomyces europaeiscabiei]